MSLESRTLDVRLRVGHMVAAHVVASRDGRMQFAINAGILGASGQSLAA